MSVQDIVGIVLFCSIIVFWVVVMVVGRIEYLKRNKKMKSFRSIRRTGSRN